MALGAVAGFLYAQYMGIHICNDIFKFILESNLQNVGAYKESGVLDKYRTGVRSEKMCEAMRNKRKMRHIFGVPQRNSEEISCKYYFPTLYSP